MVLFANNECRTQDNDLFTGHFIDVVLDKIIDFEYILMLVDHLLNSIDVFKKTIFLVKENSAALVSGLDLVEDILEETGTAHVRITLSEIDLELLFAESNIELIDF